MLNSLECNVLPFPKLRLTNSPINLFMTLTLADVRAVKRGLGSLPAGWFQLKVITADDPGGFNRQTYAVLEQIWGPAIGTPFTIARTHNRFVVTHGQDEQSAQDWPSVETVDQALHLIRSHVLDTLTTWGLQVT